MLQLYRYQGQNYYYFHHGYTNALLTPREYLTKLTDYSEGDKRLNFIVSYYSLECNTNMITKLGFGIGSLKRANQSDVVRFERPGAPYQLKVGHQWSAQIPYDNPDDFLSFHWFKHQVMCQEQPWICGQEDRVIQNWFPGWWELLSSDHVN